VVNPPDTSSARRLAWTVGLASIVLLLGALVLMYVGRNVRSVFHLQFWNVGDVADMVTNLGVPVIGIVLATRRPENRIGWMFLIAGLALGLTAFCDQYSNHVLSMDAGAPAGLVAMWLSRWLWPIPVGALPFLFLLFPDGHLHSRRWLPVAWLAGIAVALLLTASLIGATLLWSRPLQEDVGSSFAAVGSLANALFLVGAITLPVVLIASFAGLVARFRASRGEERLQLKWFVTAAATVAVSFALVSQPSGVRIVPEFTTTVTLLFLYAAIAISVLKYRLYDIDVVIGKTVVFAVLAAFITVVYIVLVVGIGTLVGSDRSPFLSAAAAAVVALVPAGTPASQAPSEPHRLRRARHTLRGVVWVNRAGRRDLFDEDVLPRMVRVLAEGIGADRTRVWLSVGTELRPAAAWPPDGSAPPIALVPGGPATELPPFPDGERAFPVRHAGELLGAISVVTPESEPLGPDRERLVADVAAQTGLVLRNVRLIEELRESRRRIVAAQDERAKALERNLHDGAQQQLVALAVKQRLAEALVERDPARARSMLADIQAETQDALENLRDLARGIYPPLLADKGLEASLEAQARKAALPVDVEAADVGRHPQEVESAVYFSCLEALQNAAKYARASRATIALARDPGRLRFQVADDGVGFDIATTSYGTGLQGMADRLDAIGGSLEIRSTPGSGTTIVGTIPVS
jgi:signal transduction histidine kinase